MTLEELEKDVPELYEYTKTMPPDIRQKARIKVHPPGGLIHQKDCELQYLGIVAKGENRVINEFENGKIYMIETNKAIDFIGEVTLLANLPKTSVTIEALTANTIVYIPRKDAEEWVDSDTHILRKMAQRTAFKLYRSSYNNGLKLYYPPAFLIADHLVRLYEQEFPAAGCRFISRGNLYIYPPKNAGTPRRGTGYEHQNTGPYHPFHAERRVFFSDKREDYIWAK